MVKDDAPGQVEADVKCVYDERTGIVDLSYHASKAKVLAVARVQARADGTLGLLMNAWQPGALPGRSRSSDPIAPWQYRPVQGIVLRRVKHTGNHDAPKTVAKDQAKPTAVPAGDVARTYLTNEALADGRFTGKPVVVSGKMVRVERGGILWEDNKEKTVYTLWMSSDSKNDPLLSFRFTEGDRAELAKLEPGQIIWVQGRPEGNDKLSSRSRSRRQVGANGSGTHTGMPRAPARRATAGRRFLTV